MDTRVPRLPYTVCNTDAFEWLKGRRPRSVHAVVTDPPYAIVEYTPQELDKKRNGRGGIWRLPQSFDGNKRKPAPRFTILSEAERGRIGEFHAALGAMLMRVLVPGGHVVVASHSLLSYLVVPGFIDAGLEFRGQIVRLVKTFRGGDRPKGAHGEYPEVSVIPRSAWEPWLVFRRRCEGTVRENLGRWGTGGLRRPSSGKPFLDLVGSARASPSETAIAPHPSLKPQAFMRLVVRAVLPLGRGVVLDPFMGAGSTIAAAVSLGYRSIGVERDAEYYRMACESIPRLAALSIEP